ncbi:MAG: DUF6279 family lipoprotein [Burkholderiales bacterium]
MRLSIIVAIVATMTGCGSFVRLAYNNADFGLRMMANDYLDLEGAQKDLLRERIDRYHRWHRRNELPRYIEALDDLTARLQRGLEPADIAWATDLVQTRYRTTIRQAIHGVTPLFDRLTSDNLVQLERKLAESNEKFEQDTLQKDIERRRAERLRALTKRARDWLGEITPAQEARLSGYAEASTPIFSGLLDERRRRNRAVMTALRSNASASDRAKRLDSLLVGYEQHRTETYAAVVEDWQARLGTLMLDIERSLSPQQRKHLIERIAYYANEFRTLARAAEGQAASTVE